MPSSLELGLSEEKMHLAWIHHADFDLVHNLGCSICASYMAHVVQSQHQPSFHAALQARDNHRKAGHFEGYADGRRRQLEDDEFIYTERDRCQQEFIEAVEVISQCKLEISGTLDALRMVTDQLQIERAEGDLLRKQVEDLTRDDLGLTDRLQDLDKAEIARVPPRPEMVPSQITQVPTTTLPTLSQKEEEPPVLPSPSCSAGTLATYASVASSQPVNLSASSLMCVSSGPPVTFRPLRSPDAAQPSAQSLEADIQESLATDSPASSASHRVASISKMRSLMIAAHQLGNDEILAEVKRLCTEAHATPHGQKTDVQKYLLVHWRNPTPGSEISMTSSIPPAVNKKGSLLHQNANPRIDDLVELWYEYLCAHRASWPRGVRRTSHNKPHLADLKASRRVARLRPEVDAAGNSTTRMEFMGRVAELFSVVGGYQGRLKSNKIRIASKVSFRTYRCASPVTVNDIAQHFARCGVTLATAAEELEPWARSYIAATAGR